MGNYITFLYEQICKSLYFVIMMNTKYVIVSEYYSIILKFNEITFY